MAAGRAGNNRSIALHSSILKFAGDLNCGVFLSQLIYWCDKGKSSDGYIYKTYREWREETLLSEYSVRQAARKFKNMGILDIKLRKANGSPTGHYKLNHEAFLEAFLEFLRLENEKIKEETLKNEDSLTETTTEMSSQSTKKNKGANKKDVRSRCFSFKEFADEFVVEEMKAEGINYYMSMYESRIGKEHPRLSEEQWNRVLDGLFDCNNYGIHHEIDIIVLEGMIDQHFDTKYDDCDYNILHFMSDGVKERRMYEVRRMDEDEDY